MSKRILMIEDNEQNRYLATFLLDIQLPGMDGHAVARALRTKEALRHVPIIAVTSYAMVGDRENVIAAGCDGYIEKPIDPDTFISTIEDIAGFPRSVRASL